VSFGVFKNRFGCPVVVVLMRFTEDSVVDLFFYESSYVLLVSQTTQNQHKSEVSGAREIRAHAVLDDRGFECFELSVEVFVLFFSLDVGDCYSLRESLIPPLDVNLGDEYLCSLSCFHDSSISHSRSA